MPFLTVCRKHRLQGAGCGMQQQHHMALFVTAPP
jgi:hypothetical protein